MESKPLTIRIDDRDIELLVLYIEEREWVSAAQVATKLMGWNLSSLRRELNQRDWDRLLIKDRNILFKLAQHGALGDCLPGHKCSIGHARSANLIALKSLPDLLCTLQPKWTESHRAVRYAMQYDNEVENEEEEEEIVENWNNTVDRVEYTSEQDSEDECSSDSEWENEAPQNAGRVRSRCLYNYTLPYEQHSTILQTQLQEFNAFMTLPIVLKRQSARVEPTTVANACRCILRFLGYCFFEHHAQRPTMEQFKDLTKLEQYFDWLLHKRNVQPQTIGGYLNVVISALKFLYRNEAAPNQQYRDIAEVETMRQVRQQVRGLVRFQPPTHEQLAKMQKWLPWDDIVKTLSELEKDYVNAGVNSMERARHLMEYLMVGLYVYFPPVRAGPIRELAIGQSLLQVNGKWHLDLRKYKTFKIYGPLVSELHADLVKPVESYLKTYRHMLLQKEKGHDYVFVNRSGHPFSASAWTSALQAIFRRKTGQMISANLLRDSFVTFVYSQDVGESLKESIALHMGHRVDTAKQVYDRRTSTERRMAGVAYASELVQQIRRVRAECNEETPSIEELAVESEESELEPEEEESDPEPETKSNNESPPQQMAAQHGRKKRRKDTSAEPSAREYYWAGVDMLP